MRRFDLQTNWLICAGLLLLVSLLAIVLVHLLQSLTVAICAGVVVTGLFVAGGYWIYQHSVAPLDHFRRECNPEENPITVEIIDKFATNYHKQQQRWKEIESREIQAREKIKEMEESLVREQEQMRQRAEEREKDLDCLLEISQAPTHLLEEFVDDIPYQIEHFSNQLTAIKSSTAGRATILGLRQTAQEIASTAQLLRFDSILEQIDKLEVLFKIVSQRDEGFRLEQLAEVENRLGHFMRILQQYVRVGERYLTTKTSVDREGIARQAAGDQRLSLIGNSFHHIYHAMLSAESSPGELARHLYRIEETLQDVIGFAPVNRYQVFEFTDLLQKTLHFLHIKIVNRKARLAIRRETPRVLLYGDGIKISKLLALFLYMSLLRAQVGSSIQIKYEVSTSYKDNLQEALNVETRVGIRNTNPRMLERIEQLLNEYQESYQNSAVELLQLKRGFRFYLPMVVNNKFANPLQIGLLGQNSTELQEKLEEIAGSFPFDLELMVMPTQYESVDILIVTAQILEQLSEHIRNKLERSSMFLPVIGLYERGATQIHEQMLALGAIDCIELPIDKNELKWCIFRCLDYLVPEISQKIPETMALRRFPKIDKLLRDKKRPL